MQTEIQNQVKAPGDGPPPLPEEQAARVIEHLAGCVPRLKDAVARVVVGKTDLVEGILYALLSRGHCLLVGYPGLAKTLLVHVVSKVLGLPFGRIQFTPDLMPADITGSDILEEDPESGARRFRFMSGPIFTSVLLADEINRTPPKTQSALLEAMQEKTVSVGGRSYRLEEPFMVLATQNPIEQEGTYPLPEAQLDRFLFELKVGYPTQTEEVELVTRHAHNPLERVEPVFTVGEVQAWRNAVSWIPAAPNVVEYAVRLVRATRPDASASPEVQRWVRCGASPRASQNLILAGRARAACEGRFNVACEDVAALAPWVLGHRILKSFQADAEGVTTDQIVAKLLREIRP